ncbi:hypothetical protein HHK36_026757 [Tetracentron sinense]|uniref:Inositol polyphosphate-related phosphatase domain-containing protein n=1 Tax=Tetracentron sinense TaxID=13715 RepID=A0A834YJB0_TETSI|nr:hypothetical protein HHK36_026757 [Tetracentron sinense]
MSDGNTKKSKLSWSKTLVRKWFNIKSKSEDFHADEVVYGGVYLCSFWFSFTFRIFYRLNKKNSDRARRGKIDLDASQVTDVQNYTIFVATWNVGGKSPPSYLNLEEWLHASPPADIYVLGFQEIVPLNAGNVLGAEDNGPARKWLALIRRTLNNLPGTSGSGDYHTPSPIPDPIVEQEADFEGSTRQKASSFFHRRSFQSFSRSLRMDNDMSIPQPQLDRRFSVCDRVIFGNRPSDYDPNYRWGSSDEENVPGDSPSTMFSPVSYGGSASMEDRDRLPGHSRYCLVASKQMVGIFLTVWVRSDLRDDIRNMKVSCVGRGLMGYLGNKGSISISMSLHQTTFCFVCSHLTSGQKDGDELRRNSDVMEILRKTRFPRVHGMGDEKSPETIHEHECDRILWYGRGLHQLSYVRGESRFSDHRPVYSIFAAEVESINRSRIRRSMSCSSTRIEVEELLPYSHGYTELGMEMLTLYELQIIVSLIAVLRHKLQAGNVVKNPSASMGDGDIWLPPTNQKRSKFCNFVHN